MTKQRVNRVKSKLDRIFYFFPFQLVFLTLKKNYLFVFYWGILFGFILDLFGTKYGIPFLFLDPEYLGNVNFWSLFIIGVTTGGIIMAYNISSYIINGFRFPFLATLSQPFRKFTLNNFIIPTVFVLVYVGRFYHFQKSSELQNTSTVLLELSGFFLGVLVIVFFTIVYFSRTNKDVYKMYGVSAEHENVSNAKMIEGKKHRAPRKNVKRKYKPKEWRVDTYLSSRLTLRLVRGTQHYDEDLIQAIFKQNHLNATIIELSAIVLLIVIGFFRDVPFFQIPAGASILLIFSIFIMISSAFRFWLRGWTFTFSIVALLFLNWITQDTALSSRNMAYGLNYTGKAALYNQNVIDSLQHTFYQEDIISTTRILEKWRIRNAVSDSVKPKMLLLNVSGGGLRAAFWSFQILSEADSALNGVLLKHAALMAGSSGGMIGASYFRELYLERIQNKMKWEGYQKYSNNIGRDLLNTIGFSVTVNDIIITTQKFKYGDYRYYKDRAYAFEKQLIENTNNVFEKKLGDYTAPESEALIPISIFAPTIINDGRRLIISSQPVSYLISSDEGSKNKFKSLVDGVEFSRLFAEQGAMNTRFTSILRMNATFPYILPKVSLPSTPVMEVMDAGLRDNFGIKSSMGFLYTFREWIKENTSGVVLVQIRDTHREFVVMNASGNGLLENLMTPIETFYANWARVQDYGYDEYLRNLDTWFPGKLDFITFQLPDSKEKVELSWHLTKREKNVIMKAVELPDNLNALHRLVTLLTPSRQP